MAKARRSTPRRPLAVRCGWCDEPLPDPSMGRRYCSAAHRQAAYRARHRHIADDSEIDQLRAQVRSLKDDRRLLEVQLQGAEERATDAAEEAAQYATMWERTARSNARLVSSLQPRKNKPRSYGLNWRPLAYGPLTGADTTRGTGTPPIRWPGVRTSTS